MSVGLKLRDIYLSNVSMNMFNNNDNNNRCFDQNEYSSYQMNSLRISKTCNNLMMMIFFLASAAATCLHFCKPNTHTGARARFRCWHVIINAKVLPWKKTLRAVNNNVKKKPHFGALLDRQIVPDIHLSGSITQPPNLLN